MTKETSAVTATIVENKTVAKDILASNHPAHGHFVAWLKGKEATRRQARKFLQAFPAYRG